MITNEDIEFMKLAREEMLAGREYEVELLKETTGEIDYETGELIRQTQESLFVKGHITEISGKQVQIDGGILTIIGDIKVDINIDVWTPVDFFKYASRTYRVIGKPQKGIGLRNRVEVVGELVH
ncbi:hypothetical protein HMH09_002434 [Listeria monocytogenes]|nr:hypothetical protein [Listeria monocytogenes]